MHVLLAIVINVAAASDMSYPMKEIIAQFEKASGHEVRLTLGSSGNFQAQIVNGAPFDVYLSADVDYVRELERRGLTDPDSIYIYAVGRLVIWVRKDSPIDVEKLGMEALLHPAARRIAIANPRHAPYGRAAVAALKRSQIYDRVSSKFVMGENVSQAAQFVASGAADAGVIAYSLALSDPMRPAGRFWEIPLHSYPRMEQAMVILKRTPNREAARAFHAFVRSDGARAILERYGFLRK